MLALGALLIAWWFWSIGGSSDAYATAHWFFNSWFGKLLLFIWTFCTFYHLCNGIRHLAWDAGYGFELSDAYKSGKAVVAVAVLLTIFAWVL